MDLFNPIDICIKTTNSLFTIIDLDINTSSHDKVPHQDNHSTKVVPQAFFVPVTHTSHPPAVVHPRSPNHWTHRILPHIHRQTHSAKFVTPIIYSVTCPRPSQ